jgi:hypothetical protein
MISQIPYKKAIDIVLVILSMVSLFHLLVLTEIIPYNIVWAGKINSVSEMRVFEFFSLSINTVIIFVIAIKANYLKWNVPVRFLNGFIWFIFFLFSLNTIGNLFAATNFEKFVFTPMTFILAVLCLRIVKEKQGESK